MTAKEAQQYNRMLFALQRIKELPGTSKLRRRSDIDPDSFIAWHYEEAQQIARDASFGVQKIETVIVIRR